MPPAMPAPRRRHLLGLLAALPALGARPARAEHGWQAYDEARPLYLEGRVVVIFWSDPHPHLELLHRSDAVLPPDLSQRAISPRSRQRQDDIALLSRAALPVGLDSRWRVDLPSLARLYAWGVARPRIGDLLGVIGFPGPPVTGTPTLRAALLFVDDRAYPLRSDPQ